MFQLYDTYKLTGQSGLYSSSLCLFVHKFVVVQLSVSYPNLKVSSKGLQTMRAHRFLNLIFLLIKEEDEFVFLYITSIQKCINLLKVVYHPVRCLLHHYINL